MNSGVVVEKSAREKCGVGVRGVSDPVRSRIENF